MSKTFFITGGSGFIGSNFVAYLLENRLAETVINLDKLTYAGNPQNLMKYQQDDRYRFIQGDICDFELVNRIFSEYRPNYIVHFAAESHVDRSIDGPGEFIQTNILGTYILLSESLKHFTSLSSSEKTQFRFHHISTDEVYGSLGAEGFFEETTPYDPSSPYSASKASSDHLVRAWHRTFELPVTISNCSNNYGPLQFPEKLIPLMILNCLAEKSLPVYGTGENVRDWLYVKDHCDAVNTVIQQGKIGETYNIGGNNEIQNIEIVNTICTLLDEMYPRKSAESYRDLITFVTDRPGHDFRYAINAAKIKNELGWEPKESFKTGIQETIQWYLDNQSWWKAIQNDTYQQDRLGVLK